MRRVTYMYRTPHRSLVGLLALVMPVVALANDGGPNGS